VTGSFFITWYRVDIKSLWNLWAETGKGWF